MIDFGIAKFPQPPGAPPFTQHSVLSGTVAYASPEQCQSRAVDGRSDIYSLGVVLYEMLTGERPFTGRTPTEIALKQIQAEPAPPRQLNPDIPTSLERTVLRMLAKNPDDRQQGVEQLTEDLRYGAREVFVPLQAEEEAEPGEVDSAPEGDSFDRLTLVRRRRRRVAVAAAAIVLIAAAAGMLFGRNWLASRLAGSPATNSVSVNPLPSPSPGNSGVTASDADSLELAAQLPPDGAAGATGNSAGNTSNGAGNKISTPTQANGSARLPEAKPSPTATASISAKPTPTAAPTAKPPAASAPPQVAAAKPQSPTPSPTVVARAPQTNNPPPPKQTETAQAPARTEAPRPQQPDNTATSVDPGSNSRAETPPASRRDRVATNRDRNQGAGDYRRQPEIEEANTADSRDEERLGPKLIQWSGSVNREREVTIELPGVPGTLEIPRVYRNRVGIVQPPSASNRWRTATVRVFGQGGVSFVVRWWPMGSNISRLNTP